MIGGMSSLKNNYDAAAAANYSSSFGGISG